MIDTTRHILLNRIKCNYCNDVIISKTKHDFQGCSCKKTFVDGGNFYLRRIGDNYTEMYVIDDGKQETRRNNIYWGSLGKDGELEELRYTLIKDLETEHIYNILSMFRFFRSHIMDSLQDEIIYRESLIQ